MDLVTAADRVTFAREHASRQLAHLKRAVDYGYPAVVLRNERKMADRAVVELCVALDQHGRIARQVRREREAAETV